MKDITAIEKYREILKVPDTESRKVKLQELFTDYNNLPLFAPKDGICFNCRRNIYKGDRISEVTAQTKLITGCPFCGISYCE